MPNQQQLEFEARQGGLSQNELLRAAFMRAPGEWLKMNDLAAEIGAYVVHSRVADCRKKWGMQIESTSTAIPGSRKRVWYYRFTPPASSQN